jgi:Chaperone of endosialidase
VGNRALLNNTTGDYNTAIGDIALLNNTGDENTATGSRALAFNTTGIQNTAIGSRALESNTTGDSNTAMGRVALSSNTTGEANTAIGYQALSSNTGGSSNVAVGLFAGGSVTTANNVICIGTGVTGADASNGCYIGNIWNQPGGSQAVYVNSDGKLGAQVSSRRFKEEIKPLEEVSEVIYRLEPVSFRYKLEIEPTRPLGFGLIAEDVAKISPDLVTRGGDGQVNSVRYDAVNAMLLNEFLKQHKNVQELKATLVQQQKEVAALIAQIKEQDAKIQRVSDQLEMSSAAPQVATIR